MLGVKRFGLIAGLVVLGLAPAAAAHGAAAPSPQDKQFLVSIHQSNLVEITTGNAAGQRGANETVENLGARFVTDYAQLDQGVQGAASAGEVTLPDAPTDAQVKIRDRLATLTGSAFDKQWISTQLTWHTASMQLVQAELNQGADPAVKQVAKDTALVLQEHHTALLEAAKKLGVPVPPGGSAAPLPSGMSRTPSPGGSSGTPGPSVTSDLPSPGTS